MATLIGILCDVSASMRKNAIGKVEDKGEWVRSIFTVIDDLIQHDVSGNNHVFAVAVGAICGSGIFDVLGTIDQVQTESSNEEKNLTYSQIVDETFLILEKNGASSIRKWAKEDVIRSVVSYDMALLILRKLECDKKFVTYFVHTCLPQICRDIPKVHKISAAGMALELVNIVTVPFSFPVGIVAGAVTFTLAYNRQNIFDSAVTSSGKTAKGEDIIEVVTKAKAFFLKEVNEKCIINVRKASEIVHGYVDERELSRERVNKLMETVEPFIYGRTPLFTALDSTLKLFSKDEFIAHKKLLVILSDGEPTDTGNLDHIVSSLRSSDVSVVSCYISKSRQVEPKILYSVPQHTWDEHASFLFRLSSTITTQLLPRTIFIKRGWKIEITNNETKLFLHVNHPDILKDACDLARNVICSQDALSDLLVTLSLDIYINQSMTGFEAKNQEGGTCYANASAAVLHLAMKRILGREGGYPDFNTIRREIIALYGKHGADTFQVLREICPRYRLRCKEIKNNDAMKAIISKRPVIARFRLTDPAEWAIFTGFYAKNPKGILTKKELRIYRPTSDKSVGHAVVLTSFNSECLRLMNSWGHKWADMGFFRIENASVLELELFDVFWTLNDLTDGEKDYYKKHGARVSANLIQVLKGLQAEKYECPKCKQSSLVTEFSGTLLEAKCPKCEGVFKCHDSGNILAMNMYLLSLTR